MPTRGSCERQTVRWERSATLTDFGIVLGRGQNNVIGSTATNDATAVAITGPRARGTPVIDHTISYPSQTEPNHRTADPRRFNMARSIRAEGRKRHPPVVPSRYA